MDSPPSNHPQTHDWNGCKQPRITQRNVYCALCVPDGRQEPPHVFAGSAAEVLRSSVEGTMDDQTRSGRTDGLPVRKRFVVGVLACERCRGHLSCSLLHPDAVHSAALTTD